jgi:Ca-activated chloride channel family protein
VKVGIVTFAGTAHVAQLPTTDRQALHSAIDGFQLQRATATGNAIVVSLGTLFPDAGIELDQLGLGALRLEGAVREQPPPTQKPFTPQPPGSHKTAAIVMLSDGQRTVGMDAIQAAGMAADRGVRVYTVGVGTVDGEVIGFDGWSMRVRLDEELLQAIAHATDAQYFYAGNADDLRQIYRSLSSKLGVELQQIELSAVFAGLGALLTLLSALWSLAMHRRVF